MKFQTSDHVMYKNLIHGLRIVLGFPAVWIITKDYVVLKKKETVKEKRIKKIVLVNRRKLLNDVLDFCNRTFFNSPFAAE